MNHDKLFANNSKTKYKLTFLLEKKTLTSKPTLKYTVECMFFQNYFFRCFRNFTLIKSNMTAGNANLNSNS